MKQFIRPFVIFLALFGVLLLSGCSGSGGGTSSVHYGVYSGYGYPYYYDDDSDYYYYRRDHYNRPDNPNRPDRPNKPDRPTKPGRPSTQPVYGGGMGRPTGMSRGGGFGGGGRGGGGRGGRR